MQLEGEEIESGEGRTNQKCHVKGKRRKRFFPAFLSTENRCIFIQQVQLIHQAIIHQFSTLTILLCWLKQQDGIGKKKTVSVDDSVLDREDPADVMEFHDWPMPLPDDAGRIRAAHPLPGQVDFRVFGGVCLFWRVTVPRYRSFVFLFTYYPQLFYP